MVEVQDATATVLDDEEAVKQLKRDRGNGEEVKRDDGLAMVVEERKPAFCWIASAPQAPQVPTDGPFRDDEPELHCD